VDDIVPTPASSRRPPRHRKKADQRPASGVRVGHDLRPDSVGHGADAGPFDATAVGSPVAPVEPTDIAAAPVPSGPSTGNAGSGESCRSAPPETPDGHSSRTGDGSARAPYL
jgi:hypothetical protein